MQEEKLYTAYIMASRSRTIYIGITNDLYTRVQQHRKGVHEGFSSRYDCKRLVWFERYTDPTTAIAREKQIKRWRREKKVALIEKENPTWLDLAADWGTIIKPYRDDPQR